MPVFVISLTNGFQMSQSARAETEILLDSYGSLARAEIYFDNRLRSRPWKKSSTKDKCNALREATQLIDSLNFTGRKISESQFHQFPREHGEFRINFVGELDVIMPLRFPIETNETQVPVRIEIACYEIALKLLDGYDPELDVRNLATASQGYSNVRNTYDRAFVLEHIRACIPSIKAWNLLLPYLADPSKLKLRRGS